MSDCGTLAEAVVEEPEHRVTAYGDKLEFRRISPDKPRVRCFQPEQHKNGDRHPSAVYHLAKHIYCPVYGYKERTASQVRVTGI